MGNLNIIPYDKKNIRLSHIMERAFLAYVCLDAEKPVVDDPNLVEKMGKVEFADITKENLPKFNIKELEYLNQKYKESFRPIAELVAFFGLYSIGIVKVFRKQRKFVKVIAGKPSRSLGRFILKGELRRKYIRHNHILRVRWRYICNTG